MSGGMTAFHPNATSFEIMKLVMFHFCDRRRKNKKEWNLISQEWILDKLNEWHKLDISRSTLCYNLAILRKEQMIDTTCRHKRDEKTGKMLFRVTLYRPTPRLKRFFGGLAFDYKRSGWVPNIRQLQAGIVPVVGEATTKEEVHAAYVAERKRKAPRKPRRTR